MKKLLISLLFTLFAVIPTLAQSSVPTGYVSVYSAQFRNSDGSVELNGTITFTPVNNSGTPISYILRGYDGVMTLRPVSALITNGSFTIQLVDTALTTPVNVCYSVTAVDNLSGKQLLGPGYTCVQPAGSGIAVTGSQAWCTASSGGVGGLCDLDNYTPNLSALALSLPLGFSVSTGVGVPSGSCTPPAIYFNITGTSGGNNNFYLCSGSAWIAVK
jgi:hypothetical protein